MPAIRVVLGYECGAKSRKTLDGSGFLGNLVALADGEVRWCGVRENVEKSKLLSLHAETWRASRAAGRERPPLKLDTNWRSAVSQ